MAFMVTRVVICLTDIELYIVSFQKCTISFVPITNMSERLHYLGSPSYKLLGDNRGLHCISQEVTK